MSAKAKPQGLFDPAHPRPRRDRRAAQARPAHAGAQPGDLRHRSRVAGRDRCSSSAISSRSGDSPLFSGQIAAWLWFTVLFANFAEAVAEGRGKAQADACAARAATRAPSATSIPRALGDVCRGRQRARPARRRRRAGRGRRRHSRRRRDHRGRRLGQRIGDHRRVRAGDPRGRRRPLGRDRRHDGALRLDQGADHRRGRARPSSTA